jgi:hypothetical protein
MIFVAVAVNQSSFVEKFGTSLKWALLAPIRRFSPHVVSQLELVLELVEIRIKLAPPHRDMYHKMKKGVRFVIKSLREEHASTKEWLHHPHAASKAYIEKENMGFAAERRKSSISQVLAAGASVTMGPTAKEQSSRHSEEGKV